MAEITEHREVRVRGEDATFVFAAEPERGRLVVREEREGDEPEELCALTIADRDELSGFLQGLRRVLGVDSASSPPPIEQRAQLEATSGRPSERPDASSADATTAARSADGSDPAQDDRRAAMERAQARGQRKAFEPWSREEERRLLEAVEQGRDLDELAREHQRSRRALELRLERLRS